MKKSPLITRLLDHFLPPDLHHLVGDLEEEFHLYNQDEGPLRAYLRLWGQVLRTLPWFISQSLIWNTVMIINYLKVTWRNIKKHKSFSLINILGLAASMSVCLLIILFIYDQKNYDRFHSQSDRIYRVISDYKWSGSNSSEWFATSPETLADIIENKYSGIKETVSVTASFGGEAQYSNDIILPIQGLYVDQNYLRVFDFELTKGNPERALSQPGSVILSKQTATKFFGDSDAMGQTLHMLGGDSYTVTGIIDTNVRSHFQFDALASQSIASVSSPGQWTDDFSNSYTYVLLDEKTNPAAFEQQLEELVATQFPETKEARINGFNLQPLTEINLGRVLSNEIGTVIPAVAGYFLGAFALIIILIACFNYISLTVARSLTRSREVGVRKVLGAYRSSITRQFLVESVLIALIALVFASILLRWLLPEFNSLYLINMAGSQIGIDFQNDFGIYLIFIAFSILTGILAGIYPALYLSKFDPAAVLKGVNHLRGFSALTLRKIIIVSQFSFSIIFIITAILLYRQFSHMADTDYGFSQEHIVHVALQDIPYDRFSNAIRSDAAVQNVTGTSKIPAMGSVSGMWVQSDSVTERIRANSFAVDENYLNVMNLKLLAGRNFSSEYGSDAFRSVILNQDAAEALSLGSPQKAIGSPITIEERPYQVVGIVENFVSSSPLQNNDPVIILNNPDSFYYAAIKSQPGAMQSLLPKLKKTWYDLGSEFPVQYRIFDEQLSTNPVIAVFGDFIKILGLATGFTILISCLGLFGMAIYTSENRTKEIGIRKVMGATVRDIIYLLSKDYLKLIGIAALIGGPAAWLLNQFWLQNVSNRIDVGPGIFILGIMGTTLLALFTVGSQTIRAARQSSVENLQSE